MLGDQRLHASAGPKRNADETMSDPEIPADVKRPPPTPAARRALAEAAERRAAIDARGAFAQKEAGGRGGLEPGRYGDWEIKGLTSDF